MRGPGGSPLADLGPGLAQKNQVVHILLGGVGASGREISFCHVHRSFFCSARTLDCAIQTSICTRECKDDKNFLKKAGPGPVGGGILSGAGCKGARGCVILWKMRGAPLKGVF